jgi:hypothetical protein
MITLVLSDGNLLHDGFRWHGHQVGRERWDTTTKATNANLDQQLALMATWVKGHMQVRPVE